MKKAPTAYCRNGLHELEQVKSLVHDILTGPNDAWAKAQLLDAIAGVEANVKKALA